MSVAASVLGYAGLGFITRCYALGLQKRNIFESKSSSPPFAALSIASAETSNTDLFSSVLVDLGGHAMLMTAFGGLGYYIHGLEGRQLELIAHKKEQILKNRERLAARS